MTDTYFGFSANDTFVVYTAGGEGLNIDSNRAVTLTGTLNMGASQKIYLGGNDSRMHVYHTGSGGEAVVLTKEGNLSLVNQSHGDDIVFKTEDSGGTVVTPLTLDSGGDATFAGILDVNGTGSNTFTGRIVIDGSNGSNGITLLRPSDSAEMTAISAPDSSTLKIGGGNQSYVKLYAHTTKVLELNNSGLATFTGNVGVAGTADATYSLKQFILVMKIFYKFIIQQMD